MPARVGPERYRVAVNGNEYDVEVTPEGAVSSVRPKAVVPTIPSRPPSRATIPAPSGGQGDRLPSPLAGTVLRVVAKEGQQVQTGDLVIVLEAMKMETEVRASRAGNVASVPVSEGDSVQAGDALIYLA